MKTSIRIKKFWYADLAADGGLGTNWKEIQIGQREASVQFQGSDGDRTDYKNVLGNALESDISKGDKSMNFQFADLTPNEIVEFLGGSVTSDVEADSYEAPENENQAIEKSIKFLTDRNVLFELPRVAFDGYPVILDDDLHMHQMNGSVLKSLKDGVGSYKYYVLKTPEANDITSFTFGASIDDSPAVITPGSHTVAITVVVGTDPSALTPEIGVSLGASITPNSGTEQNFTSPFEYTVVAADGTSQVWTVTVTVAT